MNTMRELLEHLRPAAARAAMQRARNASKIAKVVSDLEQRRKLYAMKTLAVSRAIVLLPERVYVGDLSHEKLGIIGVGLAGLGQLHVPVRFLDADARRIIKRKLAGAKRRVRVRAASEIHSTSSASNGMNASAISAS